MFRTAQLEETDWSTEAVEGRKCKRNVITPFMSLLFVPIFVYLFALSVSCLHLFVSSAEQSEQSFIIQIHNLNVHCYGWQYKNKQKEKEDGIKHFQINKQEERLNKQMDNKKVAKWQKHQLKKVAQLPFPCETMVSNVSSKQRLTNNV